MKVLRGHSHTLRWLNKLSIPSSAFISIFDYELEILLIETQSKVSKVGFASFVSFA